MNDPIRILVVDADPDILSGTARLLEKAGYSIARAADGMEALRLAQAQEPDLVLLDRDLPDLNGLEVCRRIKRIPACAEIFVVIASGIFIESEQQSEGLESGADDYLTRPIANRELLARVAVFARIIHLARSLRQQAQELKETIELASKAGNASLNVMEDALEARDRAEKSKVALLESHQRFELANQATFNVIWDWDLKTNAIWRNDNFEDLFGYSRDEVGAGFVSSSILIHPEDLASVRASIQAALDDAGTRFWAGQYRFRRKDGSYATVEDRGVIKRNAQGQAIRMLGAMQDISERERANDQLRLQGSALDAAANAITITDRAGVIQWVNPAFTALTGYSPAEAIGHRPGDLVKSGVHDQAFYVAMWAVINAGEVWRGELTNRRKDGSLYTGEKIITPLLDELGRITNFTSVEQDITERKRAEATLRLQGGALEAAANAIVITNPEGVIEWANPAFTTFTGYSVAEAISKHPGDLLKSGKHDAAFYKAMWDTILADAVWQGEVINKRKDGSLYTEEMTITPLKNQQGEIAHFVAVKQDITERKRAETELSNLNRSLHLLSACNEALVRAEQEQELLATVCQNAVEIGGYQMAWVGYAQDDAARAITPVASAGEASGYLSEIKLTWAEADPSGMGPAGRAIRSGQAAWIKDLNLDGTSFHWLEAALRRGFRGVISLPLRDKQRTFGILSLYRDEALELEEQDISLLMEMADDLAFGLNNLRARLEAKQVQQAVVKMAQGVSGTANVATGEALFDLMVASLVEALNAAGGFIAKLAESDQMSLRTIAFFANHQKAENFSYDLSGTPCELVVAGETCVFEQEVQALFPRDQIAVAFGVQAYAGTPLLDSQGRTLGLMAVFFDSIMGNADLVRSTLNIFAARAAGELERQDTDARLREQASLLDKAQDAILVRDLSHRILYWNKGAERLYGWTAEEMIGRMPLDDVYDDLGEFDRAQKLVLREGEWNGKIQQRRKDGNLLTIEGHWTLVKDEQGQPRSILAINTDITGKEASEQELQQYTNRLEAMREIDVSILAARSTLELVQTALSSLRKIVPFERAAVVLFNDSMTEGTMLAVDQDQPWLPLAGEYRPIEEFHDLNELRAMPFLDIPDLSAVPGCPMEELVLSQGLRNLVYVPMESAGALLGFLALSATAPGALTHKHAEIALDMNDQLVVAIQHTRLRESLERSNLDLESKVEERTANLTTSMATMKVLEQELLQREADARAANEAKSTFLASMSHELRTPLIGITGMLELLGQTQLDAEQRNIASVIRESSQNLLQIIGDILDFSKIEAGRLELAPQTFSIFALMDSVAQVFQSAASAKGLNFLTEVDSKLAQAHIGDALRLRQILNNFMSNAIKFTDHGAIVLRVRVLEIHAGAESVAFEVQDSGIGVSPENQGKLFAPFTQAEASTTRRFGGTGLGLVISRRLAELMGGSLTMQSGEGQGTTMNLTVDLPVGDVADIVKGNGAEPSQRVSLRVAPSVEEAIQEHSLVLLAEDHPTNRIVLTQQVNRAGYALEVAADGQEAFEQWQSGRYSLLLTDLHMPRMDGYQLTRAVRDWERERELGRTPILALTANAMGGEAERCIELGMDDYLVKPVTIPVLASKLHEWMPHLKFPEPVAEVPMEATPPKPAMDSKVLLDLCGGDAAAAQDILNDFIAATTIDLEELADAMEQKDKSALARQAHRIKGSAAMIGARNLADQAKQLETSAKSETAAWETMQEQGAAIQAALQALTLLPGF